VPALVGNVVVWKPAPAAIYSNYLVYNILAEAGVPPGVIQFIPGGPEVVQAAIKSPSFASLHFTGSTNVFKSLWKDIALNLDTYKVYPRVVGETGGKNWHVIHRSAEIKNAVLQSVRAAFEYQGGCLIFLSWFLQTFPKDRSVLRCRVSTSQSMFGRQGLRHNSLRRSQRSRLVLVLSGITSWVLSCMCCMLLRWSLILADTSCVT